MIQSLTVRDATGALGAAAGTEAGMVLTPWNPNESWTHDALVQVSAFCSLLSSRTILGINNFKARCEPKFGTRDKLLTLLVWTSTPMADVKV